MKGETMSMELLLARLTPVQVQVIAANPVLLANVFPQMDEGNQAMPSELSDLDVDAVTLTADYIEIADFIDNDDVGSGWVRAAVKEAGVPIEFEFEYGKAFLVSPSEVNDIADRVDDESWLGANSAAAWDAQAVANFYRVAADQGCGIVGGIA
jgi:hypothetical protein